jgi:hypothetical protein
MIIITLFSTYKIIYTIQYNTKFNNFFSDFSVITNRYSIIFNYFNVIRTLLLFPEEPRKHILENMMENMTNYYEEQNNKFVNVLSSNMDTYKEIINLFGILMESKNNSTKMIKENICINNKLCTKYLDSKSSIFGSGVDFAYKACITNMHNIYSDYKKLNNKIDIDAINSTIINTQGSEFTLIGLSLGNMFFYVKEKIYECFKLDVKIFNESYDRNSNILNIISIIFSVFNFLFVIIIIFLTVSQYAKPIKESSYRINCSFNYIKMYSLTNYMKKDSTCV